jgi:hypothetical protein
MKKNLLIFTVLISMFSVINVSQVNANDCSADNPCGTWAVVDNSGTVTNVIVCQESVCGQNGSFGGIHPDNGNRLVLQSAPNSETNDTYDTPAYNSNLDEGRIVKENNGVFTIIEGSTTTNVENDIETIVVTSETQRSFTYEDTVGKTMSTIQLFEIQPAQNTSTNIFITQKNNNITYSESETFNSRQTIEYVGDVFKEKQLELLLSKIETLKQLLGNWLIK